jgi:broad specificity phosphatase PhoE
MSENSYFVVIRHGPTNKDESINFDKYLKIITNLILSLKEFLDKHKVDITTCKLVIHTSPLERCVTTSKFISTYLNIINDKDRIKIVTDKNLSRWNSKKETLEECFQRAKEYGNKVAKEYKKDTTLHIFVTHSSVINSFVAGLCGKDMHKTKLHTSCLSIISSKSRELVLFNKSFT